MQVLPWSKPAPALPLIYQRDGVDLDRSTLADWLGGCCLVSALNAEDFEKLNGLDCLIASLMISSR